MSTSSVHPGDPSRFPLTLITGANGYVGGLLCQRLVEAGWPSGSLLATDLSAALRPDLPQAIEYGSFDVRDPGLADWMAETRPKVIVHLAAVVTPGPGLDRQAQYDIDVGGTSNVLSGARRAQSERLVVTSSGAAYGYHADNPRWIEEDHALRGNKEFAYAHHKVLVEQLLEKARAEEPGLKQVVLRMGTVLGEETRNQITALFDGSFLLRVAGGDDRFVFIWDQDVVGVLEHAITRGLPGIYNVAGDGALELEQIAQRLGKPLVTVPGSLLQWALRAGRLMKLTPYGPEQVRFLKYRPVLLNSKLKETFGYVPTKTSLETFETFARGRHLLAVPES